MEFFKPFEIFNEAYESRGLEDALNNKATSFKDQGITYHILRQVYTRGIEAFDNKKGTSAKQFAMKRVTDFCNHGRSWTIYDTDLAAKARKNAKKLKKKKKKSKK